MGVRFEQVSLSAWNKANTYQIGTKVKYGNYMYVAKKDVPKGINIGMTDYWEKIIIDDEISSIKESITEIEEEISSIEINESYSTTEKEVGTWIDGTTKIYQKTIVKELPSSYDYSTNGFVIEDDASYIDVLVSANGSGKATNNAVSNIGGVNTTNWMFNIHITTDSKLVLYCTSASQTSALASGTLYVTLKYTKPAPAPTRKKGAKK